MSAMTVTGVCVVIMVSTGDRSNRYGIGIGELEDEVDGFLGGVEDDAEVQARADLADLVTDLVREERRLRVVQDDRRFLIEPARRYIDLGLHEVPPEGSDLVEQISLRAVEDLALPGQP